MIDNLTIRIGNCTHNEARLTLQPQPDSEIVGVTGFVRGPFSEFAKTLTADFQLQQVNQTGANNRSAEGLVMEPCYWTPHLPFLYELHLNLKMADGRTELALVRTGIKRLHAEGQNLRLQGKRIVLRGLRCSSPDEQTLRLAKDRETTLVVSNPSALVCELASRLGVPLIADLPDDTEPWQDLGRKLDWFPAVYLVLGSIEQLADIGERWQQTQHSLVATMASASSTPDDFSSIKHQVLAVELASGEQPPAWLSKVNKPVLAMKKRCQTPFPEKVSDTFFVEIENARVGCDRWQAELAPEFDLAGYIV